jgi:hypothetical protein
MTCGGINPGEGGAGFIGLVRGAGRETGTRVEGVEPGDWGGGADAETQAPSAGIRPITKALRKALGILVLHTRLHQMGARGGPDDRG